MRQNIERIAWAILITSFLIFCLLAVGIPLSIRWYIINATTSREAAITVVGSAIFVRESPYAEPLGVAESRKVKEGSLVEAPDESSRAIITFFDGSMAIIYGKARVEADKMRSPRFPWSPKPHLIRVKVEEGRVRFVVVSHQDRPLYFEVATPHTSVFFKEGSYSVEVVGGSTEIAVRDGKALIGSGEEVVTLFKGQRTIVEEGKPPVPPLPAAHNLIKNGDFSEPLLPYWQVVLYKNDPNIRDGEVSVVEEKGRKVLRFYRYGEDGIHTETGVLQMIGKDVRDYEYLSLRFDVKILYQSLPGGGYLSSEFPLMVRLNYKDIYGFDRFWVHGFYTVEPDPNLKWPILNGEKIPAGVWYPYETGNLMELLKDTRPAYITSIQIYASGWNYESYVAEVGLIGQ
jgi:hypothetical protein